MSKLLIMGVIHGVSILSPHNHTVWEAFQKRFVSDKLRLLIASTVGVVILLGAFSALNVFLKVFAPIPAIGIFWLVWQVFNDISNKLNNRVSTHAMDLIVGPYHLEFWQDVAWGAWFAAGIVTIAVFVIFTSIKFRWAPANHYAAHIEGLIAFSASVSVVCLHPYLITALHHA